jgi:SAM-dependent methyltransferase
MTDFLLKNNKIYHASAKAYPNDHRGVKWCSSETQFLRFKVLCEIDPKLFSQHVLDIGCGFGHLVDHLKQNDFSGTYLGIDIVHEMILQARRRHPEYQFQTTDIDGISDQSCDYAIASGIFSFVDLKTTKMMIATILGRVKKGFAFNCLKGGEKELEVGISYKNTQAILDFCKSIASNVCLREDYLSNDFTVYVWK